MGNRIPYVERHDRRVIGDRAKTGGWWHEGVTWHYRPGGLLTRAAVFRRRSTWAVDVTCGWSLRGFKTRRAAMRAAERLWGYWLDLNRAAVREEGAHG